MIQSFHRWKMMILLHAMLCRPLCHKIRCLIVYWFTQQWYLRWKDALGTTQKCPHIAGGLSGQVHGCYSSVWDGISVFLTWLQTENPFFQKSEATKKKREREKTEAYRTVQSETGFGSADRIWHSSLKEVRKVSPCVNPVAQLSDIVFCLARVCDLHLISSKCRFSKKTNRRVVSIHLLSTNGGGRGWTKRTAKTTNTEFGAGKLICLECVFASKFCVKVDRAGVCFCFCKVCNRDMKYGPNGKKKLTEHSNLPKHKVGCLCYIKLQCVWVYESAKSNQCCTP